MGNFLGSKWARFMNAFVGCLWGGADAQPYSHPPFESHPLTLPLWAAANAGLFCFFFCSKWNIKLPLKLHLSN